MPYIPPKDRVLENSTSNSQTVFAVTGAIDTSFNAFSASMAVNDWTLGCVTEPGVAFASGKLTYSATNQITVDSTFGETKGTFSSGGTKEVFMGFPGVLNAARFDALAYNGMQINGSMEVSQENGASSVALTSAAAPKYIVDNFTAAYNHSAATAVLASQQTGVTGSTPFQGAYQQALKLQATTALSSPAAGDYAVIQTPLEGYRVSRLGFGYSSAQSVSIGFWVYATIAGTMAVYLRNSANNRGIPVDVVINNAMTWEFKTVTFAGDTTGTWLYTNGLGLTVGFGFCCGSTNQGTNNTWGASSYLGTSATTNFFASINNLVYITGVIVLPGIELPSSTRAPFIMRPFDQELPLCKRHFRVFQNPPLRGVMNSASAVSRIGMPLASAMRTDPTLTMTGNLPIYDGSAASTISTIDVNYSKTHKIEFDAIASTSFSAAANPVLVYETGSASLKVDARI